MESVEKTLMPMPPNSRNQRNQNSQQLPPSVQHQYEASLGQDLSGVKVHENHKPTLIGAQSFTQGDNIYFAPGKYEPFSQQGDKLLAHELTHVVQQKQGHVPDVPKGLVESDSNLAHNNNE